jgi:hypothetical protein
MNITEANVTFHICVCCVNDVCVVCHILIWIIYLCTNMNLNLKIIFKALNFFIYVFLIFKIYIPHK